MFSKKTSSLLVFLGLELDNINFASFLSNLLKKFANSFWFSSLKSSLVYDVNPEVIDNGLYGGSKYTNVLLSIYFSLLV